jgi:hypothetical protein
MNNIKLSIIGTLAMVGASFGTVINNGSETPLQTILNNITCVDAACSSLGGTSSVNVNTDQLDPDMYWELTGTGTSAATMIIEVAGNAPSNTFGIYDASDASKKVTLFSGAATGGTKTAVSMDDAGNVYVAFIATGVQFAGNAFGYFLSGPGGTFYSDFSLNSDGADKMVSFRGEGDRVKLPSTPAGDWTANEYILAWEDVGAGSDNDFNDMVVMVESVKPIPEPTTMGLMGLGLLGLVAAARRRNK